MEGFLLGKSKAARTLTASSQKICQGGLAPRASANRVFLISNRDMPGQLTLAVLVHG